MWISNLILALLLQTPPPAPKLIVGLRDGQQLVLEDTEFSGFIHGRADDAVLSYRQQYIHGEMPTRVVSRIDFGLYRTGKAITMTVTLKDGQKIAVESEGRDFLMLRGKSALGSVIVKHPDPLSAPLRLSSSKPNRAKDLTIQYLEFPAP